MNFIHNGLDNTKGCPVPPSPTFYLNRCKSNVFPSNVSKSVKQEGRKTPGLPSGVAVKKEYKQLVSTGHCYVLNSTIKWLHSFTRVSPQLHYYGL